MAFAGLLADVSAVAALASDWQDAAPVVTAEFDPPASALELLAPDLLPQAYELAAMNMTPSTASEINIFFTVSSLGNGIDFHNQFQQQHYNRCGSPCQLFS